MKQRGGRLSKIPGSDPGADLIAQLSPYVRHCGDLRRGPWHIPSRRLLDFLVVCIADGSGRFTVAGQSFDVGDGDVVWIPPDTLHEMIGHPPGMRCSYAHFDLHFRPTIGHWDFSIPGGMCELPEDILPLMHPPVEDLRLRGLCGLLRGAANRRVFDLVQGICTEATRGRDYGMLRMSALVLEMVAEILAARYGGSSVMAEHLPLLEETEAWMLAHCHEEVRIGDLAGICGLSDSRFREVFQDHFGRSPREHLRRLRIHRAQQLMLGSDLALGEVATRCGFATVHSFSRAFRAEEGVPPSQWRKAGPTSIHVTGRATGYSR